MHPELTFHRLGSIQSLQRFLYTYKQFGYIQTFDEDLTIADYTIINPLVIDSETNVLVCYVYLNDSTTYSFELLQQGVVVTGPEPALKKLYKTIMNNLKLQRITVSDVANLILTYKPIKGFDIPLLHYAFGNETTRYIASSNDFREFITDNCLFYSVEESDNVVSVNTINFYGYSAKNRDIISYSNYKNSIFKPSNWPTIIEGSIDNFEDVIITLDDSVAQAIRYRKNPYRSLGEVIMDFPV